MKRPIFTQIQTMSFMTFSKKTLKGAFSIATLLIFFTYTQLHGQTPVNCNSIMVCNDGVQISLDEDCSIQITADMILEGQAYPNSSYTIKVRFPNGTVVTDPIINATHIGMDLEVSVTLTGCPNSCWGSAKIEDKLPPVIETCPCEPRITNFTGTVVDLPTFDRPNAALNCAGSGTENGVSYIVHPFAVTTTGIVDINLNIIDLRFSIYSGTFDPANPCTNILASNVNSFSGSLTAGVNYNLVVSSAGAGVPPGGIAYSLDIDSRTGSVLTSTSATLCTIACTGEQTLLNQLATSTLNRPVFRDACNNLNLIYSKTDEVETLTCNDRFSKIIRRYWTVTDQSGNSVTKTQVYYVNRGVLADVTPPVDRDYNCGTNILKLPNGAPNPSASGFPGNIGCSNIQTYYTDIIFELCGGGIKVFRQWIVIDWCTGGERSFGQNIRIQDTANPVVTCPRTVTSPIDNVLVAAVVSTSSDKCSADWNVIAPTTITDCSSTTYTVAFKLEGAAVDAPFLTVHEGGTQVVGVYPNQRIINLPTGRTRLRYTVTDACGNFTTCETDVDVVDRTPPTAICEGFTVVSLDASGWAELFAESVDDHSNDNCGVTKFEIRRKDSTCPGYSGDLNLSEKVNFCCSDVTTPESYIKVVLRVYDAAGNFNDCEANVRVQNKRPPVILCPTGRSLVCGDSRIAAWAAGNLPFDTAYFGLPTVTGQCTDLTFNSRITSNNLNSCGVGSITRQWFVVSNPTITCSQTLTVTAPTFTIQNVTFPSDITLASCNIAATHPDVLNSKPVVAPSPCRQIGISYTDQIFYETPEACVKILRTWRVIDWCTHSSTQFFAEKVQVIKLTGSAAPRFTTPCTNVTLDTDPTRCDREVTLTAQAEDDCTDQDKLKFTWTLDLNNNASIDETGTGRTINRTLPKGTHRVVFTVENRCGVKSTCAYNVTIRSTKKPTPICYREVVWVMEADGSTEIWASDFNLKSEGACTGNTGLIYSFNAAGTQLARTFTCANIPNGQVARIDLQMFVRDTDGNFDFCDVTLILQDSPLTNACTDIPGLLPSVAGRITNEMEEGVEEIEVDIVNMNYETNNKKMTDEEGRYKFDGVSTFDPMTIGAYKNNDVLNGVSTLDLVLIQRHILGLQKFNSPYQLLAADINNSRSITASDLVNLRKLILGVTTEFENNTSWRFLPKDYTFSDPTFPYDFPNKVNLDSIFEDKSNVDFIAVKVGDVNHSAKVNARSGQNETRSAAFSIHTGLKEFKSGEQVKVDFRASDILDITGTQFTLAFDASKLSITGFEAGVFQVKDYHFNLQKADHGQMTFSYDQASGINVSENDVLFSLNFKALANGNSAGFEFNNDIIVSEVYNSGLEVRPLRLSVRSEDAGTVLSNVLFQNEPNPFRGVTKIAFELAESSPVSIRIFDINGKEVYSTNGDYAKGYHTLNIQSSGLSSKGVFYYTMEAGSFKATKKMILIE
ncbi:MAG: T9SS type A sorting domain-containing protein [Saprospiraceae bacterium]|nr:T9SS type A sorting domain-containing protein [Saprospiraceae bacterium]